MSFDYSTHLTAVVAADTLENAPGGPPSQHACLDCGAALTDRYCAHCGQPADTHRITLKHLLFHDVPPSVWHVDKGIVHTFWQILTRPGLTIRGYLARLATEPCAKAAPRRRHAVAVAACARRPPKIARGFGRASRYFFENERGGHRRRASRFFIFNF